MRVLRCIILLISLPFLLKAQTTVQGFVINSQSEPLPYVQLVLKKFSDSTLIKTEFTDSTGNFELTIGKYPILILIATVGYKQKTIILTDSIKQNALRPVVLEHDDHILKGVDIVSSKPLFERKTDRIVFNVSSSASTIGSDAYELLKRAPGVRVNDNYGISIAGKSTVSIMIDGKIQQLGSTELAAMLRSLSGENIDKIEIITTPPAKYDAQGNSGIINIVTKKSKTHGVSGNLGIAYQQRFRGSGKFNQNINYKKGKLNIYSSGMSNYLDFQTTQQTNVSYSTQLQSQTLSQRNNPFYNRYQLGADYLLTNNSIVGLSYIIGTTNRNTVQLYNAPVTSASDGVIDSILQTNAVEKEKSLKHNFSIYYECKIDTTGKKMNVEADYFSRNEDDSRDFNMQSFIPISSAIYTPLYYNTTATQHIDISSLKLDIFLPYDNIELSLGAKASFIHTISDNHFFTINNNEYTSDPLRSNKFDYKENTQAIYISTSKKWKQWESQLGLRAEYTQTSGISHTLSQTVTNYYLQFFPSVYIQYLLNDNNAFNINYSRRVGRPSYEELNPFRVYGSGNSYTTGNPFLRPSFYHTIELGYSLQSKFIFTAYAGIVNNIHARISKVDTANTTFYFTNENAGTAINTGVSALLVINPFDWVETNIQLQCYYDKVNSNYYNSQPTVNGIIAFDGGINNSIKLNNSKTLFAEIGFNYSSRFQYDFVIRSPFYMLNMGVKAQFFNKQITMGINASDILRTEKYIFENIYNQVKENNYFDARCITVSLNWKFGNQINAKRLYQKESEEVQRSK